MILGNQASPWEAVSVLVVDDNRQFRLLMRSVLQTFGVRTIHEAGNGATALDILRKETVDLAMIDLCMEPLDGLGLVALVQADSQIRSRDVKIMLVTGHPTPEAVNGARRLGIHDILAKPFSPRQLQTRMRRLLPLGV